MDTPAPKGNFHVSVRYRIECGRRAKLAKEARSIGITNALVVTDAGIAALPWFGEMIAAAREGGLALAVFDDIKSNPTLANVEAGLAAYASGGHDGLILVGGGSPMDTGKAIALLASHGGSLFEYEFLTGPRWRAIDPGKMPPTLALPTTSGSGSELSPGAVVTDNEAGVKRSLIAPALLPTAALADPEVTFGLPAPLTAATGMDALTHCLEAFCVPAFNPIADGIALEGLRLIHDSLEACVKDPGDAAARTNMMMAAGQAAVAFQKGLGLVHAMAHPLGAVTDIHHGLANAILLPYVMKYNRDAIEPKMSRIAGYLGLDGSGFDAVLDWVVSLRAAIGIPSRLAGVSGIESADLAASVAPKAMAEGAYLMTNPRRTSRNDIEAIYAAAIDGTL